MTNWKTTVTGILSFLVTTLTTLSTFLVAGNLVVSGVTPASIHVSTWFVIGVNVTLALCRAWIGIISTDADKLKVVIPPAASTEVVVPVVPVSK